MSWKEQDEIKRQVTAMLDEGIIEASSSPFCSPVVLVRKKDNSYRFCVDYCALNQKTVRWRYPLPVIEDVLDRLVKGQVYTTIDLRSGYHQIRIRAGDEDKTAFACTSGQYQFKVLPFGVSNSPASFQAAMHKLLDGLEFCDVYIDDIVIVSESVAVHLEHVRAVLQRLREGNYKAKLNKCSFAV